MRRFLRVVSIGAGLVFLAVGAAYAYFLHTPAPELPRLSASVRRDSLRVGALQRRYAFYAPAKLASHPSLVLALHGSMGNAGQMRRSTAYRFEQLADEHGFMVADLDRDELPDIAVARSDAPNIVYFADR